jgi:hypothetical protein
MAILKPFATFYGKWLWVAFSKSLGIADLIASVIAAIAAVVVHYTPQAQRVMTDLAWQIPIWSLAAVALVRFLFAPYWIWREDQDVIAGYRADYSDEMRANVHAKLASMPALARSELYKVLTKQIPANRAHASVSTILRHEDFLRQDMGGVHFNEENRQIVGQWFKNNPV